MYFPKITPLFVFLLSLIAIGSTAQSTFMQNKRLVLNYHYGFVLKNKLETAHLANQRPSGIELELNIQTKGKKEWQESYKYPETGISLQYWIMDPDKKLGNHLGLVPYIQKHIFQTNKSSLLYRIGAGLGYVDKIFDLYNNNQNNLVSHRFNFVLNGGLIYKYRISKSFSANTGLSITHFSNGGYKKPNQGINIPNMHIGLAYHFEETEKVERESLSPYSKGLTFMLFAGLASKNEPPIGSKNHLVTTLSAYFGDKINRKSTILIGMDYFYDASMKVRGDSSEIENKWNYTKAGIVIGHELEFGKFALATHLGYMFYCPIRVLSPVYQRYGLRYYFSKDFYASVSMKANLGRADFVEYGIGYRFIK